MCSPTKRQTTGGCRLRNNYNSDGSKNVTLKIKCIWVPLKSHQIAQSVKQANSPGVVF